MRRTSPTNDPASGLTLLELLVTLSVLMLIVAAMAGFGRGGPPAFDTSVRELVSQLREARADAIRTGQIARFVLDTEERRYGRPGQLQALGADIDLTVETLQQARTLTGDQAILFFPDGSSSGAIIAMSDATRSQTISVRWLTGLVRLDG